MQDYFFLCTAVVFLHTLVLAFNKGLVSPFITPLYSRVFNSTWSAIHTEQSNMISFIMKLQKIQPCSCTRSRFNCIFMMKLWYKYVYSTSLVMYSLHLLGTSSSAPSGTNIRKGYNFKIKSGICHRYDGLFVTWIEKKCFGHLSGSLLTYYKMRIK